MRWCCLAPDSYRAQGELGKLQPRSLVSCSVNSCGTATSFSHKWSPATPATIGLVWLVRGYRNQERVGLAGLSTT